MGVFEYKDPDVTEELGAAFEIRADCVGIRIAAGMKARNDGSCNVAYTPRILLLRSKRSDGVYYALVDVDRKRQAVRTKDGR